MSQIPCNTCQKPADTRCADCITTYYCNRECQKKDWKNHKSNCKKKQKDVNDIVNLSHKVCKYDQMKSCSNCNILFNENTNIITCASNGYCSDTCRQIHQTINKKNHDRLRFSSMLSYQFMKYIYVTKSKIQDLQIIEKMNEIINGVRNDVQHSDMELVMPFMTEIGKIFDDNPNLRKSQIKKYEKLMKEYDEGNRSFDEADYYN
jgi:hypothetical protein